METKLFRIPPTARDTPFIDACAAFLTPKMNLSQMITSGCNLRRVAHPPDNQLAVADRPSASDYQEEESVVDPADMQMALAIPAFQPYRGATGRAWMAEEYGIAVDTSSLLSSGMEREDTDDELCSFDLGPEPFEPTGQNRLPSDEWLDDHQQGLEPGGSEPKRVDYTRFLAMPHKPSLLDLMRNDMDNSDEVPPPSPELQLWDSRMITLWMRLQTFNAYQICQDILHPIQIRPRSVRDLGRLCNRRAHALRQFHRPQNQRSTWRYVTNRLQRQLRHQ